MNTKTKGFLGAAVVAALALASCGGSDAETGAKAPKVASMLRNVHSDYEPAESTDALADESAVVVEGKVASVADGPVIGEGLRGGLHTAILAVDVERVVRGQLDGDGTRAYVLVARDVLTEPAQLQAAYPADASTLFFLTEATFGDDVTNAGAGAPAGAKIYWPTTPQGLIMETPTGAEPLLIEEQAFAGVPDDSPLAAYVPQ
jgi:hypothetical protein